MNLKFSIKALLLSVFVLLFAAAPVTSLAQEKKPEPKAETKEETKTENKTEPKTEPEAETTALPSPQEKLKFQLLQIAKRSIQNREEIKSLQKKDPTKEVTDRIALLQTELDGLNKNFETLATQLHATQIPTHNQAEIGWLEELQEITRPLLHTLREITQRPRRIDNLKAKIESLKTKIKSYEEAQTNLETLIELNGNIPPALKEDKKDGVSVSELSENYRETLKRLVDKYDPEILQLELDETQRSLDELQTDSTTVFSVVSDSVGEFIKERGNHFLLACLTFFFLWWFLSVIYRLLQDKTKLLTKFSRSTRKVIKTVYSLAIFALSAIISLLILYLMDDWLLLSFIVLLLIALGWAFRQLIPKFLQELRLILNFGTVREGERMFWKGIPWLVKEIGVNANLMNPRLEGGVLKLPVGELIGQHSRPFVKEEEWFPTNTGDWVILSDDTFGKVLSQTPEQVIIEHLGSRKYYLAPEFLTLKPRNLSSGFTLVVKFGLDYGEQARICDELPEMFLKELEENVQDLQELKPPVFDIIKLQFSDAGASSLNLIAIAVTNGAYGCDYYSLQRRINTAMVHICNKHDLTIPFNQMTLSLSPETMEIAKQGKQED